MSALISHTTNPLEKIMNQILSRRLRVAQSAMAVPYVYCLSAEEEDPPYNISVLNKTLNHQIVKIQSLIN